ncbi:uncharacterized protein YecT [Hoeflea halophila]|uniref:Uncharacterized protein YecT n=1 Tax=Hoeflea halophila TaxID=714899 RepID=A0A286IA44_9HYPH|nr:lysozyme inhibitor LprI family protein [Hoeflea halophila]SOE16279.1 uncharacterized protein YecT [Hoeflea halophila]
MRRTSYQQIIEQRLRRGDHHRLGMELVSQITALRADAVSVSTLRSSFFEFIPIRYVTTLEVFIRGIVSELVDSSEAYFERGEKLTKGAKVDLTFAAHVDRHELTLGDFVAHSISLNSIEAVLNVLETLVVDFSEKLKLAHPRWLEERERWPLPPIIKNYNNVIGSLSKLYSVRHILTHELPSLPVFDPSEIDSLTEAVLCFIEATDWVVVESLHGAIPKTQISMNIGARDVLIEEETKLAEALIEVTALEGIDKENLRALQARWTEWADAQTNLVASQFHGGSMYAMIWASEKAELTRERTAQLVRLKSEWMDA